MPPPAGGIDRAALATASPSPTASAAPTLQAAQTPTASPTAAAICRVTTGYKNGTVNLRAGPGMTYQVIAVMQEGEKLTLLNPQGLTGWAQVQTAAGLRGYFYAPNWCKFER